MQCTKAPLKLRFVSSITTSTMTSLRVRECGHRLYMQVVSVVLFTSIYKLYIIIMVYIHCIIIYTLSYCIHVLMRDEKEERKKQARSNKQTKQSNTCTVMLMRYVYADGRKKEVSKVKQATMQSNTAHPSLSLFQRKNS